MSDETLNVALNVEVGRRILNRNLSGRIFKYMRIKSKSRNCKVECWNYKKKCHSKKKCKGPKKIGGRGNHRIQSLNVSIEEAHG